MKNLFKCELKEEDIPVYVLLIFPTLPFAIAIKMVTEWGLSLFIHNSTVSLIITSLVTGICAVAFLVVLRNIIGEASKQELIKKGLIEPKDTKR